MKIKLTNFIENGNYNENIIVELPYHTIELFKENHDDRFDVIYKRNYNSGLFEEEYCVAGYYDKIEKKLYNLLPDLKKIVNEEGKIIISDFGIIEKEIVNCIDEKLQQYILDNLDSLEEKGKESVKDFDEYTLSRYKDDVIRTFVHEKDPIIKLDNQYFISDFLHISKDEKGKIYKMYLDNKEEIIEKLYNKIIFEKKHVFERNACAYKYKQQCLNDILENKGNQHGKLYCNRKIYQSLKEQYIQTINITINYGSEPLTFKFNYDNLMNSLKNGFFSTRSYNSSYNMVAKYIEEKTNGEKNSFDFEKIISIKHGKTELYNKESEPKIKKKKDRDER